MSNTNKGLPATCYHRALHKTTLKQRQANRAKGLRTWQANQTGLAGIKTYLRNLKRQPKVKAPEAPETETK